MKASEMVTLAKHIEQNRPTMYWNNYNYYGHPGGNCGLVHDDGVQSFDCNNFVKSLINKPSIAYSTTPWDYAVPGTVIADVSEYGLLMLCDSVVWYDFSYVLPAEVLYMPGHIGLFVGEYQDPSGTVNVIEATAAMGGGVLSSYCAADGCRYDHKGGSYLGQWSAHGRLSRYIEYDGGKQPIAVDGEFGRDTVTLAQYILSFDYPEVKADESGVMVGQEKVLIQTNWESYVPGAWTFEGGGCRTILAIQKVLKKNGLYSDVLDGIAGYNTAIGLQRFLNRFGYGIAEDGFFGRQSTMAYQQFLNELLKTYK